MQTAAIVEERELLRLPVDDENVLRRNSGSLHEIKEVPDRLEVRQVRAVRIKR